MGKLKKDNFTNRYFKPDLLQKQIDLIKEPTQVDAMADAFSSQANRPALGPAQRNSNALMAGLGAGLKGAANRQRQEQLSPVLEMVGQLNARSAYLEAQMQEQEQNKLKVQELFKQNSYNLMNFSKANFAKDVGATNDSARAFLRIYKQIFGDKSVGAYSHTHDGTIFYENNDTGEIDSANIAQMIAQSGIKPEEIWGDDAPVVMSGISAGAREKFENTQEMQRLALEKERAGIRNTNAQANQHDANTQYLGMQSRQIEEQIANPPLTETQKQLIKTSDNHLKEMREKSINNKALVETLNDLKGWIQEADAKGQAGSDIKSIAQRNWAKYYTGDNEAATLADMAKVVYFHRVKEAGGSNPSTKELLLTLETIPSVDKNPKATLKAIDRERNIALKQMQRYEQTHKHFYDNNYQVNPHDESFLDNSDEAFNDFSKKYSPKKQTVIMSAPNGGGTREVPLDQVQKWREKGALIIDE